MIDTDEQVTEFQAFWDAGGIATPESKTIAESVESAAETLKARIDALLSDSIDYSADGLDDYPTLINTLSDECQAAMDACSDFCDYIDTAADPMDLVQVAQGVNIIYKLAGEEATEATPATYPIINTAEITDLQTAVETVDSGLDDLETLMTTINTEIEPVSLGVDAEGNDLGTEQPALSSATSTQAADELATYQALENVIGDKTTVVEALTSEASTERTEALEAFDMAVNYTVLTNIDSEASVSEAAQAIYPTTS